MIKNLFDAIFLILKIKGIVSQEEYDTFLKKFEEILDEKPEGISQYEFLDLINEVIN